MALRKADLHVHLLQSLHSRDIFELSKDCYREINWDRFGFLNKYEDIIGVRLDPTAIFENASPNETIRQIESAMVYPENEAGNFDKFNIRSFFPLCVTGFYLDKNQHDQVVKPILDRHGNEGISYIEYRQAVGYSDEDKEEWKDWHRRFMQALKDASDDSFQAKYIMRITDKMYDAVKEFKAENPDLRDVFVGLDFTGKELPAKSHVKFYERLREDNEHDPGYALDSVVHVGEVYFDKSIESAVRWCHEYSELGVKRMAHCIALGLDPEIALSRLPGGHTEEAVWERIDQINYDLRYAEQLTDKGVKIDKDKLLKEKS